MKAFNVWLNGKMIDTVFYSVSKNQTIRAAVEDVRTGLINHDGYDSNIRVTWPKGQRITVDVWELHGDYGQGFELLCAETTSKAIRARRREYQENAPCPLKIIRKRER